MEIPSPTIVFLITVDPMKSHRAVEALRIALGLGSHNEGTDLRLILGGRAPFLLSEDVSELVDGDILEKHLPVFLEWGTLFSVADYAEIPPRYIQGCTLKTLTRAEITSAMEAAERVLVFT